MALGGDGVGGGRGVEAAAAHACPSTGGLPAWPGARDPEGGGVAEGGAPAGPHGRGGGAAAAAAAAARRRHVRPPLEPEQALGAGAAAALGACRHLSPHHLHVRMRVW